MNTKPKMGRPKLPKTKVRGVLIQARVSPEEAKTIKAAIAKSSKSKSEWIRERLLAA